MSDLSSLFHSTYRLYFKESKKAHWVFQRLQKKQIDKQQIASFLEEIEEEAKSHQERISSLESFVTLLLFTYPFSMAYEDLLVPKGEALLKETIWDEHSLIFIEKQLIAYLLGKQMLEHAPFDLVPEKKKYLSSFQLPSPFTNLKRGIMSAILGELTEDEALKKESVEIALWHAHLLDVEHKPYPALWVEEKEYDAFSISLAYFLLFYAVHHLVGDKRFFLLLEPLFQNLKELLVERKREVPALLFLMGFWIEDIKKPDLSYFEEHLSLAPSHREERFSFIREHLDKGSLIITCQGLGTGLGSLHTKGAKIMTFGPQPFPLDGSKGFGIYKTSSSKPVRITKEQLEGWLFMGSTSSWLHALIDLVPDGISLKASLHHPKEKMAFSFFAKGDECAVQGHCISSKSLNHFIGEAKAVTVSKEEGALSLFSEKPVKVHVIPLAGEDCFWDADFLIAYEMDEHPLSLHVSFH